MRVTALVKIKASHFCGRATEYKNINEFTLVDHDKIDKKKFYIDKKCSRIIFSDTTFLMFNSYADLVANLETKVIKWVEKNSGCVDVRGRWDISVILEQISIYIESGTMSNDDCENEDYE